MIYVRSADCWKSFFGLSVAVFSCIFSKLRLFATPPTAVLWLLPLPDAMRALDLLPLLPRLE